MTKYNRESVEKEIKKSGVSAKEASLIHKLLKGHQSRPQSREWSASEAYLEVCWHREGGE